MCVMHETKFKIRNDVVLTFGSLRVPSLISTDDQSSMRVRGSSLGVIVGFFALDLFAPAFMVAKIFYFNWCAQIRHCKLCQATAY